MYFPDLLLEYEVLHKEMKETGFENNSIISEIEQAIFWMRTGYDPAIYRSKTRTDAFLFEPHHMQQYVAYISDDDMLIPEHLQHLKQHIISDFRLDHDENGVDEIINIYFKDFNTLKNISIESKNKINAALKGLSDTEKASFIATRVEKITFSKVAKMLGVTKGTIQCYVRRAEQKIQKNIS